MEEFLGLGGNMQERGETSLLDRIECLPEEMQNELFNYLEYGEVLRLRRVCNRFRHLAETHLTRKGNVYPKINFRLNDNHCLSEFKTTRFSKDFLLQKLDFFHDVNEDTNEVWKELLQSPDLDWFMKNYAPFVKHLRLTSLDLPIYHKKQLKFLESFSNLEAFECDRLHFSNRDLWECYFNNKEPVMLPVFVPNSFKSLKRLLVSEVVASDIETDRSDRFWIIVNELLKTTLLEDFAMPMTRGGSSGNLDMELDTLVNVIKSWEKRKEPKSFKFKLDNVKEWDDTDESPIRNHLYQLFFQVYAKANLLFEDVHWHFDTYFHSKMGDQFAKYVKSMVCGCPELLQFYNYENLEAVEFRVSGWETFRDVVGNFKCPKLRGLSLYFEWSGMQDQQYERRVANRLFHNTKFDKLTSLALQFENEIPYLVTPTDLVSSCANLKHLCLQNMAADSSYFVQLWKGLSSLEHLKLSGCASLDDESFIGHNPHEPAICQMKNLKYLELINLQRMSRVTDKTLTDAIRHIKLRCFRLMSMSCDYYLRKVEYVHLRSPHVKRFNRVISSSKEKIFSNNISLDGIRSLKTGVFAETIEQLDLNGLYIENVPEEDLLAVQKEFRSWHF